MLHYTASKERTNIATGARATNFTELILCTRYNFYK
jgi:hypothetical protein